MARTLGLAFPVGGLVVGVAALALWVSALPLRWLDLGVGLMFAAGLGLAIAGYLRGADERTRRASVIAMGWNAFGLLVMLVLYAAG